LQDSKVKRVIFWYLNEIPKQKTIH
jgi:hypothetical protein